MKLIGICVVYSLLLASAQGFAWTANMREKFAAVNADNCNTTTDLSVNMPDAAWALVTNDRGYQASRLAVLNRAHFFTYIFQKLNNSRDFMSQPDLDYYALSSAAVEFSVPGAVGSGIYFDKNTMYPNYDRAFPFNKTYPLFAPKAIPGETKADISIVNLADFGNYTKDSAKRSEPWFALLLPDPKGHNVVKELYEVEYTDPGGFVARGRKEEGSYFGPSRSSHDQVKFTKPYFDCGRTNKWIITAVAPIIDLLPRNTYYMHLRRYRIAAVAAVDMELSGLNGRDRMLKISDSYDTTTKMKIMHHLPTVTKENCGNLPKQNLSYPESMIRGKVACFSNQVRVAERLANFLNGALGTRYGDGSPMNINKDQIYGEVLATVMADPRIASCGVYFDLESWWDRYGIPINYFAPRAWRESENGQDKFKVKDMAIDLPQKNYTTEEFFTEPRRKIAEGEVSLDITAIKPAALPPTVRSELLPKGTSFITLRHGEGYASGVTYDCEGLGEWLWTYSVPFYNDGTQFGGVVTIDVKVRADDFLSC